MLSASLSAAVAQAISHKLGRDTQVLSAQPVSGGCINKTAILYTSSGPYFAKWNSKSRYPLMFQTEAKGLELLQSANSLSVPTVLTQAEQGDTAVLILECIKSSTKAADFWQQFGQQLAKQHACTAKAFGLEYDNYIGSLPQSNKQRDTWVDFLVEMRLEPQLKAARDAGLAFAELHRRFERLYPQLENIFPNEPPALLHGDLWSGNYLVGAEGEPVLIDPAVYYGHREMDLGMMKLFGGFEAELFEAYMQTYPLEQGWVDRLPICNLYPLLVHVNLFGRSYLSGIEQTLKGYT